MKIIRSELKKCNTLFNEAWLRKLPAAARRLNEKRNDLLLQLLGVSIDNKEQLHKLHEIYLNLMIKAENNEDRDYYRGKIQGVRNALQSNKTL